MSLGVLGRVLSIWVIGGLFLTGTLAGVQAESRLKVVPAVSGATATVLGLLTSQQGQATCLQIVSSGRIAAKVYAVENPVRVVIDAPGVAFRLPIPDKVHAVGAVQAIRYGQMRDDIARIVVDLDTGARLGEVLNDRVEGEFYRLSITLPRHNLAGSSGKAPACREPDGGEMQASFWARGQKVTPAPPGQRRALPVVVLDPGHGGIDPGAVVNKGVLEKAIVLAVSLRLARRLRETGRYKVVLTRATDKFISLDDRIAKTRLANGSLFISLHADSIDDAAAAAAATGAAVYILSHRASDAIARRLAEKENAADLLGGVLPARGAGEAGVRSILVDLLKRETERESKRLRTALVEAMRGKVPVARQPHRSAAFHVLKQTETPAALIELGYLTNVRDLRMMRQQEWQDKMAAAITAAVEEFFKARAL